MGTNRSFSARLARLERRAPRRLALFIVHFGDDGRQFIVPWAESATFEKSTRPGAARWGGLDRPGPPPEWERYGPRTRPAPEFGTPEGAPAERPLAIRILSFNSSNGGGEG